jgi:hypothetical protein
MYVVGAFQSGCNQGCQIFLDTIYQNEKNYNITTFPNGLKYYQMALNITKLM